jgi:molybdopterin-binding protein
VSCSKELSKEEGNSPAASSFYATLEGKLWNADSLQSLFQINGGLSINGLSKTGDQISIVLSTFNTGVFTLGASADSYAFYTNILAPVEVDYYSNVGSAGGTVTITSIDSINHLISGTFTLTLVNPGDNSSKTITSGVLNSVPYTGSGVIIPPPGNSTDTLKALVGGNKFDAAQVQVQTTSGQIIISGISNSGVQNLLLSMPDTVAAGTYDLDFTLGEYAAVYYTDVSNPLVSNANGTLVIISNNTATRTIIGTFSFNASSMDNSINLAITSGYFDVKY